MRSVNSFRSLVRTPRYVLLILLSVFVIAYSFGPVLAQTPFVHESVGLAGALSSSLAFDGNWVPHIAVLIPVAGLTYDVWYARKDPGGWFVEFVASVTLVSTTDAFPSLAVDDAGTPHIVYVDTPAFPLLARDITHAVRTGGVWVTTYIDGVGDFGGAVSIDVDPAGFAHVSYYKSGAVELWYATEFAAWAPELVDATGGSGSSIAVDDPSSLVAHISYIPGLDLYYARRIAGAWATELVVAPGIVGLPSSLALDAQGHPHVSYIDLTAGPPLSDLVYATRDGGGVWMTEIADGAAAVGYFNSIALDADGEPHISHTQAPANILKYTRRVAGTWFPESVTDLNGGATSIALGIHGNPHITHVGTELVFSDAAVHLESPSGGETWPVGSVQTIEWRGMGAVDISLSVDGGNSFELVRSDVTGADEEGGGTYSLLVPHRPSRFCVVKVERSDPFSYALTDSFFTIETSVALLALLVSPPPSGPGLVVSWSTDPGPEDLAGYRLEKRRPAADWTTLASLIKDTSYDDVDGQAGDRYRLYAINGLGEEFYLGETDAGPTLPPGLSAWPVPYHEGDLTIAFPATLGGQPIPVEVAIYDVSGRRVRTVAKGTFSNATQVATWDGRDSLGRRVATGVYFVKAKSASVTQTKKVVVIR